jgi:hypothetical protein
MSYHFALILRIGIILLIKIVVAKESGVFSLFFFCLGIHNFLIYSFMKRKLKAIATDSHCQSVERETLRKTGNLETSSHGYCDEFLFQYDTNFFLLQNSQTSSGGRVHS